MADSVSEQARCRATVGGVSSAKPYGESRGRVWCRQRHGKVSMTGRPRGVRLGIRLRANCRRRRAAESHSQSVRPEWLAVGGQDLDGVPLPQIQYRLMELSCRRSMTDERVSVGHWALVFASAVAPVSARTQVTSREARGRQTTPRRAISPLAVQVRVRPPLLPMWMPLGVPVVDRVLVHEA